MNSRHKTTKLNKTYLSLSLLLVASPWILLYITTGLMAHQSVLNSVPCWSDELAYWHEILSFTHKGIDFGYYSMNEAIPANLSFGTHGFGAVSVYALFGKIFGWKAYSLVIANAFFMSLALLLLVALIKISTKSLFFILIFCLTFTPLILFSATSMTELLNFSVIILYFGLLQKYMKTEEKKWLVLLIFFCTAISFIRIIYIILFLPLLFKRKNAFKFDTKFLILFTFWMMFSGMLFLLNNRFVSPYPESFLNELFSGTGIPDFVSNFVSHFVENTLNLINPVSENVIQVLQRYFLLFFILISLVKSTVIQSKFKKIDIDYFSVFLILFLFLLVNLAAYDVFDWRDYRVLAPVLFGCVLYLMLNEKGPAIVSSMVFNLIGIVCLVFSPQVVESFQAGRYSKPVENKLLNRIEYTVHPASRFENTIVIRQFNTNTVSNIPAGIGISYSELLSDKLKSKYIYSDKKLELMTYKLINYNETGYLYKKKITDIRTKIQEPR